MPAEDPVGAERERLHGNGDEAVRAEVEGFFQFRREREIAEVIRAKIDDDRLIGCRAAEGSVEERPFDDVDHVVRREQADQHP